MLGADEKIQPCCSRGREMGEKEQPGRQRGQGPEAMSIPGEKAVCSG